MQKHKQPPAHTHVRLTLSKQDVAVVVNALRLLYMQGIVDSTVRGDSDAAARIWLSMWLAGLDMRADGPTKTTAAGVHVELLNQYKRDGALVSSVVASHGK